MTPERKDQLRRARRAYRARHPEVQRESMRRYRLARKLEHLLATAGITTDDLRPWLEQVGKARRSLWRSRARDLWDAWQLLCEQQGRRCFACGHDDRPLVGVCRTPMGEAAGAVCGPCASVLARVSCEGEA